MKPNKLKLIQIEILENRLSSYRNPEMVLRPNSGWINAVRTALGMTMQQLAKRQGDYRSRIKRIEADEVSDRVTIKTLRSIASALDSDLVYAIVPKKPLEEVIIDRYNEKTNRRLKQVERHMSLEDQEVEKELLQKEKLRIEDINLKGLWDD